MSKSPNYAVGTIPKIGFVIHGTIGNYEGAIDWLCTTPEQRLARTGEKTYSSAHYVIAKDGRCEQLVEEKDVAWHAGTVSNPTEYAKSVLPKTVLGTFKNPNESFIGIELEWFVGDSITDSQYNMVTQIIRKSGIKNPVILCHKEIASFKSDFQTTSGILDTTFIERLRRESAMYWTPQKPVTPPTISVEEKKAQIIKLINEL